MNVHSRPRLVSKLTLSAIAVLSLAIFFWPFLIPAAETDQANLAQTVFLVLMPTLLLLAFLEISRGDLDSRRLATLSVLIACNSAIRLLGAGVSGVETVFFLIVLGGYVFGPSFGFLLGSLSLLASALLAAGIGPWLPFQMMAAALVGLAAGCLAPLTRIIHLQISSTRAVLAIESGLLIGYSVVASFAYGALMTMWNWPFLASVGSLVSYQPGAPISEYLTRFIKYEFLTGGLIWDFGRASTSAVLIAITAPALLTTLRRAANRAGFRATNTV